MPPAETYFPRKINHSIFLTLKTIVTLLLPALCMHSALAQQPVKKSQRLLLYNYQSLEDSIIRKSQNTPIGINEGWSIYKDIIFPGTSITGKMSQTNAFLPGNTVLICSITGGDAYNNLFFTYTLAKKWAGEPWVYTKANSFTCSMDFYIDGYIDCDTPDRTQLEGLEFIFQQAMPPSSFLWGLQWSKQNVWSYWDDTKINQRARGWVPIPELHTCMKYNQWNHISIYGHRNEAGIYYDSMVLNNTSFAINTFVPKSSLPPSWSENYLQIGFQINGNKAVRRNHKHGTDPVRVMLNEVGLKVTKEE